MSDAKKMFEEASAEMRQASDLLDELVKLMLFHNKKTRELSDEARAVLHLPYDQRISKLAAYLTEYSKLIEKIGQSSNANVPRFKQHLEVAIANFNAGATKLPIGVDTASLASSIDELRQALDSAQINISFFIKSVQGVPNLGDSAIQRRVEYGVSSLESSVAVFKDLGKELKKTRNRLVHTPPFS